MLYVPEVVNESDKCKGYKGNECLSCMFLYELMSLKLYLVIYRYLCIHESCQLTWSERKIRE
jgi:hypothetical protein